MATDFSHGWTPPSTIEEFKDQYQANPEALFYYIDGHLKRYRSERDVAVAGLDAANKSINNLEQLNTRLNLDLSISNSNLESETVKPKFRSEKFPDPEKFNGDRANLPGFLTQLMMKLTINSDRYNNESAKVIYSVSRLEGKALIQVVPLVKVNPAAPFVSVQAFVQYLESSFGDPDPRGTARRELIALKQGKGDFSSYYSQFLRIMAYLDYNESAQIDALKDGLSDELKYALSYRTDLPKTTSAFAAMINTIDNQVRGLRAELSTPHMYHLPTHPPISHPSHQPGGLAPMDLSASYISSIQRPAPDNRYIVTNGQRKLTAAEKQWRRQNNLCTYCASSEHFFSSCPTAKNKSNPNTSKPASSNDNQSGFQ